jgi:hypothetical protein
VGVGKVPGEASVCGTQFQWVEIGPCRDVYPTEQMHSLDDLFPRGEISNLLSEYILLMVVILNRRLLQRNGDGGSATTSVRDPDVVMMAAAYDVEDLLDDADFKYRMMIAFLPGAGIFYSAREIRRGVSKVVTGRSFSLI